MARYLSWIANAALFILCALLFSSAANAVLAAWLTPEVALPTAETAQSAPVPSRSWSDREVILTRNLFNASLLAPAQAALAIEEELEATRLPLVLLGTLASPDPEVARAAIEDQEEHKHLVVRVGQEIKNRRAKVERIERRRVVLSENGTLRELTFGEDNAPAPTRVARGSARSLRQAAPSRRRSARRRETPVANRVAEAIRNPADLFSQARILPKWENGQMVGVQVSAIKPGSLFQELGIENGEVITQLNGIQIDSPERSAEVMMELSEARELSVTVAGPNGERTLQMATGD